MSTTFPIRGDSDKKIGAFFAPLSVSAQDTPNLTVRIRTGSFINSQNVLVEYLGGNTSAITAPTTNARWSIVGLTNVGAISIIHGTSSVAPSIPEVPSGILPLAAIYMTSTTTTITDAMIMDIRPFIRSVDNVPDVSAELANRPTFTDMNNGLVTKADTTGTPETLFEFNKDFLSGTPADSVSLVVKRGALADASIRWNESYDTWEFSNDGVTFSPFVSSVGTFAPIIHSHVSTDISDFTTAVDARVSAAVIPQSQVTNLVSDLANKASASTVSAHVANSSIHFTLPIAQADVTGLTATLGNKLDSNAPDTMAGNLTVQVAGNQPITLSSSDTGSSGLVIDRSGLSLPNARFEWDETAGAWLIGTTGAMDTVLTDAFVATKADKVLGATSGHIATLDVSGNLVDSGFAPADFASAGHVHTFASLTSKPTTLAGYGITDAVQANAPVVGNTATKVTYDSKGLITSSTTLSETDLPTVTLGAIGTFNKLAVDTYGRVSDLTPVLPTDITGVFSINANQVLAGPVSGGAAAPAFRSLVDTDIPTIAQSQVTNLVTDLGNKQPLDADLTAIAALTGTSGLLTTDGAGVWSVTATSTYQPADADLTAIAALTGTSGFLKTDGAGVWSVDIATYQPAGSYQPLDADLTSIAALTGTSGFLKTDGAGNWSVDIATYQPADADLTAIAALTGTSGLLTTDGAGVWSVTAISTYQPLDADLTSIAALTGTSGLLTTDGAGNWSVTATSTFQPAGSYQPLDADLTSIAALTGTSGLLTTDGAGNWSVTAISTFQPLDADLTSIAALTGTSGLLTTDGAGNWSVTATSTYQPADADLTSIAGLTPLEGQVLVRGASAWTNSVQYKVFEGTIQTTDATATLIKSVAVASNKATTFTVLAHGFQSAGSAGTVGDTYSVTLDGTIKNVAGTTALVGAVGSVARNDAGASTWTIVASANDTTDALDVTVTGEVNKTIDWFITIQLNVG